MDDAGHHLGDIHLAKPLEEHHQRLRAGIILGVIEEGFGVHSLVIKILKSFVSTWYRIVDVRVFRMKSLDRLHRRKLRSAEPSGRVEIPIQKSQPRTDLNSRFLAHELFYALIAKLDHI